MKLHVPARPDYILGRHELAPPPTFVFGKIDASGLKMGAKHSIL